MVNRDLLAAKLAELADRVTRVRARCPATADALRHDHDALELVSFNLMLAVQTCADIASHLIADEGWAAASTLAAGFQRIAEHGAIAATTAEALGHAVGLRSIVAHGHGSIDTALVHAAGTRGLADLEAFAREVASWAANGH